MKSIAFVIVPGGCLHIMMQMMRFVTAAGCQPTGDHCVLENFLCNKDLVSPEQEAAKPKGIQVVRFVALPAFPPLIHVSTILWEALKDGEHIVCHLKGEEIPKPLDLPSSLRKAMHTKSLWQRGHFEDPGEVWNRVA